MKTTVKITNVFAFSDQKYIFDAEIIEGDTLLKGYVFTNKDKNLKFEVNSVGMSKSIEKNNFPLVVKIGISDFNEYKDLIFEKI